jgi:sugar phosphate permease
VHLAVVLVPLTAIGVIVVALHPSWRRRFHVPLFVMSIVSFVTILVVRQTGEQMYKWMHEDPPVAKHRSLADWTLRFALVFMVLTGVMSFMERKAAASADGGKRTASTVTGALALLAAVLVVVWVARTGHEGARLTWKVTVEGAGK